jgi:hypothetical protein
LPLHWRGQQHPKPKGQPPASDEETRVLGDRHDQRRHAPQQQVAVLSHAQAAASTKAGSERSRRKTWQKFQSHLQLKGQPPNRDDETRALARSHAERRNALQQYSSISHHGQAAASTKEGAEKRRQKTRLSHLGDEVKPNHQKA